MKKKQCYHTNLKSNNMKIEIYNKNLKTYNVHINI